MKLNSFLLYKLFVMSFNNLKYKKWRSFLTSLGIVLGIAAVITTYSTSEGMKKFIEKQVEGMGSNLIFFQTGSSQAQENDVQIAKKYCPNILNGAIYFDTYQMVKTSSKTTGASIIAADKNYNKVITVEIDKGRYLSEKDFQEFKKVCVIGSKVESDLFGSRTAVGSQINIGYQNIPCTVIGVFKKIGNSQRDRQIVMPKEVVKRYVSRHGTQTMVFSTASKDFLEIAKKELSAIFKPIYPKLSLMSSEEFLRFAAKIVAKVTIAGLTLSIICLLVGGIGLMNIMLVSVAERKREIGIKRALGFRRKIILTEFLIESVSLCIVGGMLGFPIGLFGGFLSSKYVTEVPSDISLKVFLVAFLFSTLIGVVFGYSPAKRASSLTPVEALMQ